MKKSSFLLAVILIGMVAWFCWDVAGAESQSLVTSSPTIQSSLLAPILDALTAKSGWLLALMTWMATLRIFFKPIMTAIEKAVKDSPSTRDDALLLEVEHSKGYVTFCWLLDLLASVKIGTQLTVVAQGASDPRVDGFVPASPSGPRGATGPTSEKVLSFAILALFCAVIFSGCAVLDKAGTLVTKPVVSERVVTNTVSVVTTNFVPVAVAVPGETRTVTNVVEHYVTNVVERVVTQNVTNFVEKAGIETGLAVAKAGASLAPPPYNAIAAGVLAAVTGGLGFLVKRKNDQVNAANASIDVLNGENDSQAKQLQAVVQGVEQVTSAIDPATGEKVKGIIAETSKALGVSDDLHATVQALTVAPAAKAA